MRFGGGYAALAPVQVPGMMLKGVATDPSIDIYGNEVICSNYFVKTPAGSTIVPLPGSLPARSIPGGVLPRFLSLVVFDAGSVLDSSGVTSLFCDVLSELFCNRILFGDCPELAHPARFAQAKIIEVRKIRLISMK
jgi:hypothetical protein